MARSSAAAIPLSTLVIGFDQQWDFNRAKYFIALLCTFSTAVISFILVGLLVVFTCSMCALTSVLNSLKNISSFKFKILFVLFSVLIFFLHVILKL